ncbi:MAG: hypothetical protein H7X86_00305 [Gorillibacterium sp.]|nr:hypothetical protein [Gorillibacterium sp.]
MYRGKDTKNKYLFNVDIMVEGYSNGIALESLLHSLNQEKFLDYEVKSGIELGQLIRSVLTEVSLKDQIHDNRDEASKEQAVSSDQQNDQKEAATRKINSLRADHNASKKKAALTADNQRLSQLKHSEDKISLSFLGVLDSYKTNNTLVRLTILKGKGIKISIPCRILNYEEATDSLTVYHVDEKIVYQFRLTEVDDLSVNA